MYKTIRNFKRVFLEIMFFKLAVPIVPSIFIRLPSNFNCSFKIRFSTEHRTTFSIN